MEHQRAITGTGFWLNLVKRLIHSISPFWFDSSRVIWIILQSYIIFNIYANVLSIFCTHYRRNCKKTSITVTHNVLLFILLGVTLVLGCRQRVIKTQWFFRSKSPGLPSPGLRPGLAAHPPARRRLQGAHRADLPGWTAVQRQWRCQHRGRHQWRHQQPRTQRHRPPPTLAGPGHGHPACGHQAFCHHADHEVEDPQASYYQAAD